MTTKQSVPSAEAMVLLKEIIGSCGKAEVCRFPPCACAESIDALCKQRIAAERMLLLRAISALSWCVGWIRSAGRGETYPERELQAIQAQITKAEDGPW